MNAAGRRPADETRPIPLIRRRLIRGRRPRRVADQTLFPRWAADQIGVNVNDTDSLDIVGIGGQRIPAPSGKVDIELSDQTQNYRWASMARFVSLPDPQTQLAILGHEGCPNFFTATFDGVNRSVDLMPNNAFPGA